MSFGSDLDGSKRGMDSDLLAAMAFAIENTISMGWGVVNAYGVGAYLVGALQQLSGIALNVIIFAIVCTKLQHPKPDILFAERLIVATRDGIPTLLIRLGNMRCNIIYHPEVRVAFLFPTKTKEGLTPTLTLPLPPTPRQRSQIHPNRVHDIVSSLYTGSRALISLLI